MVAHPELQVYVSIDQQTHALHLVHDCRLCVLRILGCLLLNHEGNADVVVDKSAFLLSHQVHLADKSVDARALVLFYAEKGFKER